MNALESWITLQRGILFPYKKVVALFVYKFFAVTKINDEDLISFFSEANQKIFGINIVIDQIVGMNPRNSIYQLISY
jgi:hypothetical protein